MSWRLGVDWERWKDCMGPVGTDSGIGKGMLLDLRAGGVYN